MKFQEGLCVQNAPQSGKAGSIRLVDRSSNTSIIDVDISKARPAEGIPVGAIVMFRGDMNTLPLNWRFCDGNNGTPNLRNKFILAGSNITNGPTGGTSGSSLKSHTHTVPAGKTTTQRDHIHSYSVKDVYTSKNGKHTHTVHKSINDNMRVQSPSFPGKYYNYGQDNWKMSTAGNHTHTVKTNNTNTSSSGGHNHSFRITNSGTKNNKSNLPPYFGLAYIMKVK